MNDPDKKSDLIKYRDLVIATLDYYLNNKSKKIKTADFDSDTYFHSLKLQTGEHFQKGRLSKLKQWLRDLTEEQRETNDLKFNAYLINKTGYDVNIFEDYYKRVDKIIANGKIITDNQYRDISSMVDQLCHLVPTDNNKISMLNKRIADYEPLKKRNKV